MLLAIDSVERLRPQNSVHYFPTIGSTMTEAIRLAQQGAPHGTVVVAEEQTAGLGRFGRNWISEAGVGLYTSTLLLLSIPPHQLPIVSLLLALATSVAIEKSTLVTCDLRWPNDVLIAGSKVAGILPHLVGSYVVAGIGINVNNTVFEPGLRTSATSLKMETKGKDVSREAVLIHLLESIDVFSAQLLTEGCTAILDAFTKRSSYVMNRRIVIEDTGQTGITAGLDENGFLLMRSEEGKLERIAAGGVRPIV